MIERSQDDSFTDELRSRLSRVGPVDMPPFAARALLVQAQRVLQRDAGSPLLERIEAPLLLVLSATHLVWALVRIWAQ